MGRKGMPGASINNGTDTLPMTFGNAKHATDSSRGCRESFSMYHSGYVINAVKTVIEPLQRSTRGSEGFMAWGCLWV